MDIGAFYAVVAGINFTLLGLWWVAVQDRPRLRDRRLGTGRMSYVVSLQFVIPGTVSLFAQVAPDDAAVWRTSFTLAGLAGAVGILLLAPALTAGGAGTVRVLLLALGIPLYTLVALTAALPVRLGSLTGLQTEAILFGLLILLGTQTAWAAAMSVGGIDDHEPRPYSHERVG